MELKSFLIHVQRYIIANNILCSRFGCHFNFFFRAHVLKNAGEHWWPIEARSAAVSNSYYAVALNRVGAEKFQTQSHWTGKPSEKIVGPFYGSTYLSAPNGCRTKVKRNH